ncbi:MAG TPA: inositol monophosphatase family protein [Gemmatimonadales bacterium]|jgi:myo-inositol-1(or 4)-monophosphatase
MTDAARLARLAERAAAAATSYLLNVPRPDPGAWVVKGHRDFVTNVDRTAEALIRDDLLAAEPDSRVLGEELSADANEMQGLVWVVDPLDGTTNFLHGYPWWSVSIAAVIDGEPVAGTVWHVPIHRRYTAWRGGGAWSGGTRLKVSQLTDPSLALIGTGFPFKTPGDLGPYLPQFERIVAATSGVRRAGSAALDLVAVAAGEFDGFWELTLAPWDKAAGMVLIREAGGVVTGVDGSPARVEHGGVVAGNPAMHAWLLEQISEADAAR